MHPGHREILTLLLDGPVFRDKKNEMLDYRLTTELIVLRWIRTDTRRFHGLASTLERVYEITDAGRAALEQPNKAMRRKL